MNSDLTIFEDGLRNYNQMINASYHNLILMKFPNIQIEDENFSLFPLIRFDVFQIYNSYCNKSLYSDSLKRLIIDKLLDIKSLFFYLVTLNDRFYIGSFEVIGNGEVEKMTERQVLWLQKSHYKVFILSSMYEKLIDLFVYLYLNGKGFSGRKDKISKNLANLFLIEGFDFISETDAGLMKNFRENDRSAEVHKTSKVFRQLFESKWNNFDNEEEIVNTIISKLSDKILAK